MKTVVLCFLLVLFALYATMSGVSAFVVDGRFDNLSATTVTSTTTVTANIKAAAPVLDVRYYGAVGDGTTDDTAALQAAITAAEASGCDIFLPPGTFKCSSTLYLDSSDTSFTYRIRGAGRSTILKPTTLGSGYLFKLNENSAGSKVLTYPTHPRLIIENLAVDGSGSTAASLLWYNEASFALRYLYLTGLKYGATGTGYTDNAELSYIYWTSPVSGGWLYKQGANGDSFVARQIFMTGASGIWLYKTAGAVLEALNGGWHKFAECQNVSVVGGHFESAAASPSITISGSSIRLEDNYFANNSSTVSVYIDDDGGAIYRQKSNIKLISNIFDTSVTGNATTSGNDIYINNFGGYSRLLLDNNVGQVHADGRWVFDPVGLRVAADDSGINALFAADGSPETKRVELRYINGAWALVNPDTPTFDAAHSVNTPTIDAIAESALYFGNMTGVHYYYKVATRTPQGTTLPSSEADVATTGGSKSVQLTITPQYAPSTLRVWRGESSGTYNRYVDIPTSLNSVELYDQGDVIAGYSWITAGVPAVPVANTTFNGIYHAGRWELRGGSAPSTGTWSAADVVWNAAPAGGGYVGFVCVTSGTPGTWRSFGAIIP